ncbi:hypothetical protein L195_g041013, partial [Trifolium pratense]
MINGARQPRLDRTKTYSNYAASSKHISTTVAITMSCILERQHQHKLLCDHRGQFVLARSNFIQGRFNTLEREAIICVGTSELSTLISHIKSLVSISNFKV